MKDREQYLEEVKKEAQDAINELERVKLLLKQGGSYKKEIKNIT